tara:strand:+ start:355 stop:621 length:267 start_codon:yes stop_codon:yes gene_type:complete
MSTKTKQELPKWFKGTCYSDGAIVKNPFSGEEYKLNNVELSMYDFIIGSQMVFELAPNTVTPGKVRDFQRGLRWFSKNNIEAYMVLLD